MTFDSLLHRIRTSFGQPWIIAAAGTVYVVSQSAIAAVAGPIGIDVLVLQVTGFTAQTYAETFSRWDAAGLMPHYRGHFLFDDVHWLWYTALLLATLSFLLERARATNRASWLLLLPLIAGPCDVLENTIQSVFLSAPGYALITDPLAALSTVASLLKWSFSGIAIGAGVVLLVKGGSNRGESTRK